MNLIERLLRLYVKCPGDYLPATREHYERTGEAYIHVECGEKYTRSDLDKIPWSAWEKGTGSGSAWPHKHCPKCGAIIPNRII
jgi:hypothetical protein